MKTIVLTGGGTAGHVTPNIALVPALEKAGFKICYIGSDTGMERDLIGQMGIPYYGIPAGKLRRYLDIKNITDMIQVIKGVGEAYRLIGKLKPQVVFSKGGFVAVPVVVAAKFHNVPVIIHESDLTAGLANKIAMPFAKVICASFPETMEHIPKKKSILTGTPIRQAFFNANPRHGWALTGFDPYKPVVLFMGGSLGSKTMNQAVRDALPDLLKRYQIIHICGKNNVNAGFQAAGYQQFEYIGKDLPDLFAIAALVVSRAGANSIYEFLALKKPNLLIPLSKNASRGDQILNAGSFKKQGFSAVLEEEKMDGYTLVSCVNALYEKREQYMKNMEKSRLVDGVSEIMKVIREVTRESRNRKAE